MPTKNIALLGAGLMLAAQNLHAQTGADQMVDNARQRHQLEQSANAGTNDVAAPELYAGETSDLGPQSVLKLRSRRWHLEAFADEQYFYTDNMFLSDQNRQGADVLVSTIQATLAAPSARVLGGELTPRIGFQQQWFTFGLLNNSQVNAFNFNTGTLGRADLDTFDFNAQTFLGDVNWTRDGWTLLAGFDFRRLLDSGGYNEFYREYVPNWGLQKTLELTSRISATAGYQGDYRFTKDQQPGSFNANLNDRTDHSLYALLNFNAAKHVIIQPYYRFQFSHYTGQSRDDYLNSCGVALYFPITSHVSLRTFFNYNMLNTDGPLAQSYNELDTGVGLTLNIRF